MEQAKPRYERLLLISILFFFLLRLIPASLLDLGNDEVYYMTYPLHMQWNYFDHPPMVAVWIRLFTANLRFMQEGFIRLGSMLGAALCSWIMFRIGVRLHSARAGWMIALLYNASIYASVIAGIFIMPDSPQMVFWCWSLLQIVKITENEQDLFQWSLLGLSSGLCMMSKVHGVFLWTGIGLFMLFRKRAWFRMAGPYIALLTCMLIFTPVIWWNIKNDFITYRYHSARIVPAGASLNYLGFFRELLGEILYNNPFNVIIIFSALLFLRTNNKSLPEERQIPERAQSAIQVFNLIALPLILILIAVSLFRDTLPHWSGPAYVSLMPLAGIWLASQKPAELFPGLLRYSVFLFVFFLCAALSFILNLSGTIGKRDSMRSYGQNDFTLDITGWKQASVDFARFRQKEIQNGVMPADAPMVASKWFPAAHEDFYICRPLKINLIGLGNLDDLHHFILLNKWRGEHQDMHKAWCIVPSNVPANPHVLYKDYYTYIDSLTSFPVYRNGKVARFFSVFILNGYKGKLPLPAQLSTSSP